MGRGKPAKGELRVSRADRDDAVRRLRAYESKGYLAENEAMARIGLVEASTTTDEIAAAFVDLPQLGAKSPSTERRISQDDRADAVELLREALLQHRITADEFVAAKAQVDEARTRQEIDAAFHGLTKPKRAMLADQARRSAKEVTTSTGRAVRAGGRRVVSTVLRTALVLLLFLVALVATLVGNGVVAAISVLGALLVVVSGAAGRRGGRSRTR